MSLCSVSFISNLRTLGRAFRLWKWCWLIDWLYVCLCVCVCVWSRYKLISWCVSQSLRQCCTNHSNQYGIVDFDGHWIMCVHVSYITYVWLRLVAPYNTDWSRDNAIYTWLVDWSVDWSVWCVLHSLRSIIDQSSSSCWCLCKCHIKQFESITNHNLYWTQICLSIVPLKKCCLIKTCGYKNLFNWWHMSASGVRTWVTLSWSQFYLGSLQPPVIYDTTHAQRPIGCMLRYACSTFVICCVICSCGMIYYK